jgi:hypothetical protein
VLRFHAPTVKWDEGETRPPADVRVDVERRLRAAIRRAVDAENARGSLAVQAGKSPAWSTRRVGSRPIEFDTAEFFEPIRFDVETASYELPSYQGSGERARVRVAPTAAGRVVGVEVYLNEGLFLVLTEGIPPSYLAIRKTVNIQPGATFTLVRRSGPYAYEVTTTKGSVKLEFSGPKSRMDALDAAMSTPGLGVPVVVNRSIRETGQRVIEGKAGSPTEKVGGEGESAEPLHLDLSAFTGNSALSLLYLDFLAYYAGLQIDPKEAINGLTADAVRRIVDTSGPAKTVTAYFTQGWREYEAASGRDISGFGVLEQTILTQWSYGNFNALHNRLAIGKDHTGLGIFLRGTPLKYYDAFGQPIAGYGGGYHDQGFRAYPPPAYAIEVRLPAGLAQVFAALKQEFTDSPAMVYQAAKGYVDNKDLLIPYITSGWDAWPRIEQQLKDQAPILLIFLIGHTVAVALQKAGGQLALIGVAIDLILDAAGWLLGIQFFGTLFLLAVRCGVELSLIHRKPGEPLDALSQRHLETAVPLMRQLIESLIIAGLTYTMIKTLESTVVTFEQMLPPPSGGGRAPGLVPATPGVPARLAPSLGAPAAEAVPATTGGPRQPLPTPKPLLMASHGQGAGGAGTPGAGTKQRPPEPRLADKNAPLGERLEFLKKNADRLGPIVRTRLATHQAAYAGRKLTSAEMAEINKKVQNWEATVDKSLREDYAVALNLADIAPFPIEGTERVAMHAGGEAEQLSAFVETGEKPTLQITSRTAAGETVKIDRWDPVRRVPVEDKTTTDADFPNLRPQAREERIHEYREQMERHAAFARDWGLSYYEWQVPAEMIPSLEANVYAELPNWARNKIRIEPSVHSK